MTSPSASDEVRLELDQRAQGSVYRLTVCRPAKLNTLNSTMLSAMRAALARIRTDDGARAVILRGAGDRAWIGGADISEMAELDSAGARRFVARLHDVCRALRELPVPVIARIDGYCLGAGLEIAACCDLRIASQTSRFAMPEVQVGIPSVIEAALLPRLIGSGRARDLVLTGRPIDAGEALSWGLVETVTTPERLDVTIEERLAMILDAAPGAVRSQKALCRLWEELPLDEAVQAGMRAFENAFDTDEPQTFMRRFLERRRD